MTFHYTLPSLKELGDGSCSFEILHKRNVSCHVMVISGGQWPLPGLGCSCQRQQVEDSTWYVTGSGPGVHSVKEKKQLDLVLQLSKTLSSSKLRGSYPLVEKEDDSCSRGESW